MKDNQALVIIPTYQEAENIRLLIPDVLSQCPHVHILVVDDGSPDGTAGVVKNLPEFGSKIHILERQKKDGLGRAYLAGFKWGISHGYDYLIEMDADFSHRSIDLVKIVFEVKTNEFVVGSRWVVGGGTSNWSYFRKLISRGGSIYARLILGYPLKDWTGGFNGWQKKVLEGIDLDNISSEGYSFQIELKYRALKHGFNGVEVPILFEERRVGMSKMSLGIVLEALYRVWGFRMRGGS